MLGISTPKSVALADGEGERVSVGAGQVIFKSPAGSGDGWTVVDHTLPARQVGAPPHYHRQLIESFYVLCGELWIRVGDQEFNARPGFFTLINPGIVHAFANRSDSKVRFLAHASHAHHKTFLLELFKLIQSNAGHTALQQLGERYDTYYV